MNEVGLGCGFVCQLNNVYDKGKEGKGMIHGKIYKVYTYLSKATTPSNPGVIRFASIENSRFSTTTYLPHHCLPGTLISKLFSLNLVLEYSPYFF